MPYSMMKFILEILLTGLAILITGMLLPGVHVSGYGVAVLAGIILGLFNATIGLLLRILTFPLNVLTLGLMSFIISVFMVLLVGHVLSGFYVHGFINACFFAIVLAVFKMIFHTVKRNN
jgi:putative membrane protein